MTKPIVAVVFFFVVHFAVAANVERNHCKQANDCVAVGCSCNCSGCGGFDYQAVVNKHQVKTWYEEKKCNPATICPEVCCPRRKVVCVKNVCGAEDLK